MPEPGDQTAIAASGDRTVIANPGDRTQLARLGSGTRLNDMYAIESLIGSGGFSEVYKAHNILDGHPVAVKLLSPAMYAQPVVARLFSQEADILRSLVNEAIVKYYGSARDPVLNRPYLAMEFVDGPSLADRIRDGVLTPADATVLLRRLALGFEAAHRLGVVHRDVSPDNIILPGSEIAKAKIVDFGIARQTKGKETILGDRFAGKESYASPEQLGLIGEGVDAKSDVYSFGLVMAEALTGKSLGRGRSQFDINEKRRSVPSLEGVPPEWQALLTRMLQPEPAKRPSMAEVAAWNFRKKVVDPVVELSASDGRGDKKKQRRLLPVVLTRVALALVVIGAVGAYLMWPEPEEVAPPVVGPGATQGAAVTPDDAVTPPVTQVPPPATQLTPPTTTAAQTQPASPPAVVVEIPSATYGRYYEVTRTFFAGTPGTFRLRTEGVMPVGLSFDDRGGGAGVLQGIPRTAGDFTIRVIAENAVGIIGTAVLPLVVVREPEPPAPEVLLADFNRGACQYAAIEDGTLRGFGRTPEAYNLLAGQIRPTGAVVAEPQLIQPAQCPGLVFAAAMNERAGTLPLVAVRDENIEVGVDRLGGEVTNFAEPYLYVLAVFSDGAVVCIPEANIGYRVGGGRTFEVNIPAPDPQHRNRLHLLLAVAMPFKSAALGQCLNRVQQPAATLLPALRLEIGNAGGRVGVASFRLN